MDSSYSAVKLGFYGKEDKKMKRFFSVLFILLFISAIKVNAEEILTAEKKEDIKKLLEVTGALNVGKLMSEAVMKQMVETIKKVRPDIPAHMFDIVSDEVNKTFSEGAVAKGGYIDLIVVIYHRYFSHSEIKGLISFYQTPLGKKTVTVMPTMTQEAIAVGQRWGQGLVPIIEQRIKSRFKQKGIEL
jgi:hypothetical protein